MGGGGHYWRVLERLRCMARESDVTVTWRAVNVRGVNLEYEGAEYSQARIKP